MKHKDIILLLGSTFFVVIVWIIFNIYHNLVVYTIPEVLEKEILPINPAFDQNSISKIKQRSRISPIYDIKDTATKSSDVIEGDKPL